MPGLPAATCPTEAELEFDRQVEALLTTGLPEAVELAEKCFRACVEPLRDLLPPVPGAAGRIPFVVVFPTMPVRPVLEAVHAVGGAGFTTMSDDDLAGVRPVPQLQVPTTPYLLLDVDLGADPVDVPKGEVLAQVPAAGRTPLTVAEGLALLVSDPRVLRGHDSLFLAGSTGGDGRIPALWRSARRPRLGWDRDAPRTGPGTATCADRRGEPHPI